MRKLKIYLDTSIISHLFADDTPEKMEDTNRFWMEVVNAINHYREIGIMPPAMLLEEDE